MSLKDITNLIMKQRSYEIKLMLSMKKTTTLFSVSWEVIFVLMIYLIWIQIDKTKINIIMSVDCPNVSLFHIGWMLTYFIDANKIRTYCDAKCCHLLLFLKQHSIFLSKSSFEFSLYNIFFVHSKITPNHDWN